MAHGLELYPIAYFVNILNVQLPYPMSTSTLLVPSQRSKWAGLIRIFYGYPWIVTFGQWAIANPWASFNEI
jgi:hypothetical protein